MIESQSKCPNDVTNLIRYANAVKKDAVIPDIQGFMESPLIAVGDLGWRVAYQNMEKRALDKWFAALEESGSVLDGESLREFIEVAKLHRFARRDAGNEGGKLHVGCVP